MRKFILKFQNPFQHLRRIFEKCREKNSFDEATMADNLADKIKAKNLKLGEITREELPGLIKSTVGEEVKKLLGVVNELSEENNRLKD